MSGNAVQLSLHGFCAHIIQRSNKKDQYFFAGGWKYTYIFKKNGWRDRRGFPLWFNRIDVGVCTTLAIATTKRERERESGATPKVYEEKGNPELSTQSLNILGLLGPSSFIRQLLCAALRVFCFGLFFFIDCGFFLNCVSIEPVIWSLSLSFHVEENSWDLFLDSSRFLLSQLPVDSCNKTIDEPVHQVENIFGNEISRLIPNLEIEFQFEQRRQRPKKRKNFFGGTSSERSVDSARGKNKKKKK